MDHAESQPSAPADLVACPLLVASWWPGQMNHPLAAGVAAGRSSAVLGSGSTADLTELRAMAGEWEFNSSVDALVAALSSPAVARLLCAGAFAVS